MATKGMMDSIMEMFDLNKDGSVDFADLGFAFKKVLVFLIPVLAATAKAAASEALPVLAAGIKYVAASNVKGAREDVERAALQASIEHLKGAGVTIGVDAAVATVGQMLDGLANHFGMSTSELDATWKAEVLRQKLAVPDGTQ